MLVYAQYAVIAALVVTVASAVAYIVAVYRGYQAVNAAPAVRRTTVRVGADDRVDELSQRPEVPASAASAAVSLARVGTGLAATALVLLTVTQVPVSVLGASIELFGSVSLMVAQPVMLFTVTLTPPEVALLPLLSVALAVRL